MVDIDASFLERKNGRVAEWPQSRGYIRVRKPGMLRMKALVHVVRNVAFDMVTNGQAFGLSIPPKNQFLTGIDRQPAKPSPEQICNLLPQHIFGAFFPKAPHKSTALYQAMQQVL